MPTRGLLWYICLTRHRHKPPPSEHGKCIQWESITGLPNKGLVTFEEKAPGLTAMELTISYSVPKPIAKVWYVVGWFVVCAFIWFWGGGGG